MDLSIKGKAPLVLAAAGGLGSMIAVTLAEGGGTPGSGLRLAECNLYIAGRECNPGRIVRSDVHVCENNAVGSCSFGRRVSAAAIW